MHRPWPHFQRPRAGQGGSYCINRTGAAHSVSPLSLVVALGLSEARVLFPPSRNSFSYTRFFSIEYDTLVQHFRSISTVSRSIPKLQSFSFLQPPSASLTHVLMTALHLTAVSTNRSRRREAAHHFVRRKHYSIFLPLSFPRYPPLKFPPARLQGRPR